MFGLPGRLGKKLLVHIGAIVSIVIVTLSLWVMYNTLHTITIHDVIENVKNLSGFSVVLAILITGLSYFVVTGYDVLALRHIKRKLPYKRTAMSAFLASTFGNNIGLAILTGTSIRYRMYSVVGLSALEIAGISAMCALTTFLGMSVVFSMAMLFQTGTASSTGLPIPPGYLKFAGGLVLCVILGYIFYTTAKPVTIQTRNWSLRLPSAQTTLSQIALATCNITLVSTLIFVLLPQDVDTPYIQFLSVFVVAIIAGSASNVPGGIGVFESILLVGLPEIPAAALLGSILLFRCIYYLTPLFLAATVLAVHEASLQQGKFEGMHERTADWLNEVGPEIMAFIVVVSGSILLFTNSIPHFEDRSSSSEFIPLFVVEMAYLAAAGVGVTLMLLAHSISQRLDEAYRITVKALLIGIVACLLRAFDFQEAVILTALLILIIYTRPEFYRKSSIFRQSFPPEWISLISVLIAISIWIGLFSYKAIAYDHSLWLYFDYQGEYSRFLRSLLIMEAIAFVYFLGLISHSEQDMEVVRQDRLGKILPILEGESTTRSNLVLLADKRILFNKTENAFIMYQVYKKHWIALSDPIGPMQEYDELRWQFMTRCAQHNGSPVFFQVDESQKSKYIDLGLSTVHIGDDAQVSLTNIDISSRKSKELLRIHKKVQSEGLTVEVINKREATQWIKAFKEISNSWLSRFHSKEYGFSKGRFDPFYLKYFPFALIRNKGRLVAFANLWVTANKHEISIDLIRHTDEVPKGILDFLNVELMLWGRHNGYQWFNLGLAPLARMDAHPLKPLWSRIGPILYPRGEHFGNFEDLRKFSDRYEPTWKAKYAAFNAGLNTPSVFLDIAKLTAQDNPV